MDKNRELVLIKLGGSLITDKSKPFTAKEGIIKRLGKEIYEARKLYRGDLIIGHGSGSFGHTVAAKYQTQDGIVNKKSIKGLPLVADAAIEINRIVIKNFLKVGLPVVSFAPASFIYSDNKKTKKVFIEPIIKSLELGFIPVIYGDIIFDESRGFCIYSGEMSLNLLAINLKKNYKKLKIIYCGDTDGVYDGRGRTIPKITPDNFAGYKKGITGSKAVDVTGGMLHKVKESLKVAGKYGIETTIINGNKKNNLKKAISNVDSKGTRITKS